MGPSSASSPSSEILDTTKVVSGFDVIPASRRTSTQRETERDIRRSIPLNVEVSRTFFYQIPLERGVFDLLVIKAFVPPEKEEATARWKTDFEKRHGLHVVIDHTTIGSGMNEQLRAWAGAGNILNAAHVSLIRKSIESYFGKPPPLNGLTERVMQETNLLPDRTEQPMLAIDPSYVKDREDLLSARHIPGSNDIELKVGFIDVTTFVAPGDERDQYALRLGETHYGTHFKIPTLGTEAAFNLASFNEGEARAAFVVRMIVDKEGNIKESSLSREKIKNHRSVSPQEAHSIAQHDDIHGSTLRTLAEVSARLRGKRVVEKGIFRIENDEAGSSIVAECMVASKSELAAIAEREGIPVIRKVHTPPTKEMREDFTARILARDIVVSLLDFEEPLRLARLLCRLEEASEHSLKREILDVFLTRSFFDTKSRGHFGLGKKGYLEIKPRESAGLANQYQFRAYLDATFKGLHRGDLDRRAQRRNRQKEELDSVLYRLRFLERVEENLGWVGREFSGTVQELKRGAALVDFPEFTRWGVVPFEKGLPRLRPGQEIILKLKGFNVASMRFEFGI